MNQNSSPYEGNDAVSRPCKAPTTEPKADPYEHACKPSKRHKRPTRAHKGAA